ncbi:hypothetical protein Ocin01_10603 [Orchesella cincta]|uniref:F-box domain-containing protein n=1 Tax=Orchesella cincta TaxID=48709 RepID=A0A1D2MSL5_ORCCI|nr:hypothetical protein Ocin01_10603 [Orchesella cincta]
MMEASPFSEAHPLLNHVVLHRLFNLMKFDIYEFVDLRLVCRQWFNESLPMWRKNVVVCATDDISYPNHLYLEDYLELLDEESFYEMRKYPYSNYKLRECDIRFRGRSGELSSRFWTKVGPLMTHLTIKRSRVFQAEDLRKVIFELTPNLRYLALCQNFYHEDRLKIDLRDLAKPPKVQGNLVEFKVRIERWNTPAVESQEQELPLSWMEIFLHFPNLKLLDPKRLSRQDSRGELGEIVNTLKTIRREVSQQYFVGLEQLLFEYLGSVTVGNICQLQFPLKKLSFNVGLKTKAATFTRLLEAHSQTLRSLDIQHGGFSPPFLSLSFQKQFEFLAHLYLLGPILPNLNFLKNMPNLETLRLQDIFHGYFSPSKMIGNTDFLQLDGVVLHKMNKLWIGEEICSGEHVAELAKLMPNLRRLRLGLGDDGFKMVCRTWEKLETLDIRPCQLTKETKAGSMKSCLLVVSACSK